ncbi:YD repeat protein [Geitlerinema sp. FC II]|nr:YD repeat protein [Geitlerinema sp. FC II]
MRGLDLISQQRGDESRFYLQDGHSGVRLLTDELGTVTDTYEYGAYGEVLSATGATENPYLYRGESWDSELGLQYLRSRYYEPETGRFLSTDPFEGMVESPVSRHRYLYGNANPVVFEDPSGEIASILSAPVIASTLYAALSTVYSVAAPIIGLSVGQATVSVVGQTGTNNSLEWKGDIEGIDANFFVSANGGILSARALAATRIFGYGLSRRFSGKWMIVTGGINTGALASIAPNLAILDNKVTLTSPRAIGAHPGTFTGGVLFGGAVSGQFSIITFIVGFGIGRFDDTIDVAAPSTDFNTAINLNAGISLPIRGEETRLEQITPE